MTSAALPDTDTGIHIVPLRADAPTIGLVSVAHGMSHFGQLLVPPLFPWIGAEFGLSNTQLGALLSVFFVVSFVGQALAGFVVDRYGAQRVLFMGVGCIALGALGLSMSPNYATMLAFMALAGLDNCVFHPVDFSILNSRISAPRLGQAYAAHGISGSLGWALAPVFVVGIVHAGGTWRTALTCAGALVALVWAVLWWQRRALALPPLRAARKAEVDADGSLAFLRLPAVWSCFAFFFVYALALGGLQSFAPAAAGKLHEMTAAQLALCLSIYMVAAAAGALWGGQLLRDPSRSAHVAATGFGVAAIVALMIALGDWSGSTVLVLFAVMGLGSGIAGPSRDLLVKQATPPGATGRVYGIVYSGLDVGMMTAPLLYGALMDAANYRAVWIGVALLLTLLIASAFNVRSRWRAEPQLA